MKLNNRTITAILFVGVLTIMLHSNAILHFQVLDFEMTADDLFHAPQPRAVTSAAQKNTSFPDDLIRIENIPPFMRDYFEWHGKQIKLLKHEAKHNSSDDSYLGNYKFLVLRCAHDKTADGRIIEDRCGGLSDRLKSFPLFLWYAATSKRILFFRWGRPAPIETFLQPRDFWNWTIPDPLMRKIEKLDNGEGDKSKFSRQYFTGMARPHKQMLKELEASNLWMIEAYDHSGGSTRYKKFVEAAIEKTSASNQASSNSKIFSKLEPRDAFYENFYHDLFHATFRPSLGVKKALDSYFFDRKDGASTSWLPVPLQRNNYAAVQFRAAYPGEPWRESPNRTLLEETTIHAVECVKSRVLSNNTKISAVYFASDTALAVEAAQNNYHENNSKPIHVWTSLDLESYDNNATKSGNGTRATKRTTDVATDPPHLNFSDPSQASSLYAIFVDLFLMSYSSCVVYAAGGFGRFGSLVSYRPWCGMPYSVNQGKLQQCSSYKDD